MSAAASTVISDSKWTMLSGALKGAVQDLTHPVIIIGRSSDCDIVIVNDLKCSRKHAKVEITHRGFEIQSLSANNALKVNGEEVQKAVLKDGDTICIGETEIRFNTSGSKVTQNREVSVRPANGWTPQVVPSSAPQAVSTPYEYPKTPSQLTQPKVRKPQTNYTRFYVYGGIILLGFWLFSGTAIKKKKEISIRGQEQIDQDIEAAKKLQEAAEEVRRQSGQNPSFEMRQAQENYVKGFRDYRKGQYERALESFQACLALAPDHILCNRYLRLSQRKFNELIQYHMVLGRKYRDQEQYRACRSAFRNVMVMVKELTNPTYKEAKANFDACNSFVEGNF